MSKKRFGGYMKRTLAVALAAMTVFTTMNLTGIETKAADGTNDIVVGGVTYKAAGAVQTNETVPGSYNGSLGSAYIEDTVLAEGESTKIYFGEKSTALDWIYYGSNPSSSDSSVASVSNVSGLFDTELNWVWLKDGFNGNIVNTSKSATITAGKAGTATITSAFYHNIWEQTGTGWWDTPIFENVRHDEYLPITITVIPSLTGVVAKESCTIDFSNTNMEDLSSTVYGLYSDNTYRPVTEANFTSDNEAVATVDNGIVTAWSKGTANITVSLDGKTTVCAVEVTCSHTAGSHIEADAESRTAYLICDSCGDALTKYPTITYIDVNPSYIAENPFYYIPADGINVPDPTSAGFTFTGWFIQGDVTLGEDITMTANWAENLPLTYYLLIPDKTMPGVGNTLTPEEILALKVVHQKSNLFKKVGVGTFSYTFAPNNSYAEDYLNPAYIGNSDMQQVVEKQLLTIPNTGEFHYDYEGYRYTAGSVNWYVIKNEKDGWHADGLANWNSSIINYKVTYRFILNGKYKSTKTVAFDVKNNKDIASTEDSIFSDVYTEAGISAEDYYIDGFYMDKDCTTPCTMINTQGTFKNVTLYAKFVPKTELIITATNGSSIYDGTEQEFIAGYDVSIAGLKVEGITSIVKATNAGSYPTYTTGTLKVMNGTTDVTKQYKITFIDGNFEIVKANVDIVIADQMKTVGTADPTFTGKITSDSAKLDLSAVKYERKAEDAAKEAVGDDITIVATNANDPNVNWTIKEGKLTITAKEVITLYASSGSTKYNGNNQSFTATYSGNPIGVSVSGLTSTASATDVGTYSTATTGTARVFVGGIDETYKYEVNVIEGTYTIVPANVTVAIDSYTKNVGEADPTFTATVTPDVYGMNYGGALSFSRKASQNGIETAGSVIDIECFGPNTWNTKNINWTVTNGTLTIAAPVIPDEPVIETPVVVPTPPVVEIPDEDVPQAPGPEDDETVDEPTEEPIEEEPVVEEPEVEIPDEETPLAENELTEIPDEEVALAADLRDGDCWIHWLILLLTALFGVYSVARCVARNRKIKELTEDSDTAYNRQ